VPGPELQGICIPHLFGVPQRLPAQLMLADGWLVSGVVRCCTCSFRYDWKWEAFGVRRKDFWPLDKARSVLDKMIPKLCHESDGLILQVRLRGGGVRGWPAASGDDPCRSKGPETGRWGPQTIPSRSAATSYAAVK
jgi:hypothetical protein